MFIELKGVQFENKGAELMLLAILQRLKPEFPQGKFVLEPREGDYEKRAALGLYQKFEGKPGSGRLVEPLFGLIPERYRKRYGIVRNREVSVVLDASGFAYSDQWGLEKTRDAARAAREWKKQDTTLVLLPQAFGPFTSHRIKREFASLRVARPWYSPGTAFHTVMSPVFWENRRRSSNPRTLRLGLRG